MKQLISTNKLPLVIGGIANMIIVLVAFWQVLPRLFFLPMANFSFRPVLFGLVSLIVPVLSAIIGVPICLGDLWLAFRTHNRRDIFFSLFCIFIVFLPLLTSYYIFWIFNMWPGVD
jgi:heme/copper-type cytochrome/quinol oxidase subunit 4